MGITEIKTKEILDFDANTQKWLEENGFKKTNVGNDHFVYVKGVLVVEIAKAMDKKTNEEKVVCIVSQSSRFLIDTDNGDIITIQGVKVENIENLNADLAELNAKAIYDLNQFYNCVFKRED